MCPTLPSSPLIPYEPVPSLPLTTTPYLSHALTIPTGHTIPPKLPPSIAGLTVESIRDLTIRYDNANPPTYTPALPLSSVTGAYSDSEVSGLDSDPEAEAEGPAEM